MKHGNLLDHYRSKGHQVAEEYEKTRNLMPGTSTAEKTLETLNKNVFEKLDINEPKQQREQLEKLFSSTHDQQTSMLSLSF